MGTGNKNKVITKPSLYWDKRIKKENSQSYQLLMYYSQNIFSYCIFDSNENEFLGINTNIIYNTLELEKILKNNIFDWNFESSKINIQSIKSTVIPNSFFEEKMVKKYLYFNEEINDDSAMFSWDELKYMDAMVAYSLNKQIKNIFKEKFKKIKFNSQASVFIDSILRKSAQSKENIVFIDLCNNKFDIGIIKQSKLFLYNNFIFSTIEDFLYYILNCYNTLNLDIKKTKLYISGEFQKNELIPALKDYLNNITLAKKEQNFHYSNVFNTMPDFYFQKLFNLIQCV